MFEGEIRVKKILKHKMFYSKVSRQLRATDSFAYFLSFQIPFDGFLPVITQEVTSVTTPKYFT
jgi:hypothetical protein